MQQQDVEQLVEQVAQRLGRGLSLEDLDGLLLAYSSNQSHADRVRVNFLLSKRVPVDVIAWQLSHGIATSVRPTRIWACWAVCACRCWCAASGWGTSGSSSTPRNQAPRPSSPNCRRW